MGCGMHEIPQRIQGEKIYRVFMAQGFEKCFGFPNNYFIIYSVYLPLPILIAIAV